MTTPRLVDHFFRHEYGRMVSVLSRQVGVQHIDAVEDAVQSALMKSLDVWTASTVPDNPSAWLFRVARNELMGNLREGTRHRHLIERHQSDVAASEEVEGRMSGDVQDDLLRMLFVCCDTEIPIESQLVFALKILCGFGIREIAVQLFTTEANVYKRFARARSRLRKDPLPVNELTHEQLTLRLPAVTKILYVLFTEGYLSSHGEIAIRHELCSEAIRLATILAEHPLGAVPETFALLALMHLHSARLDARQDALGDLLLLEEQDRSLWDRQAIQSGLQWLAKSAHGDHFSRYHAEAGIAAEHCLAASFDETRWEKVADCYALLERLAPSPLHMLNRAIAVAEWQGPRAGLDVLNGAEPPRWLAESYLWSAVLADLNRRCGNVVVAEGHRDKALESAPTPAVTALLKRRFNAS